MHTGKPDVAPRKVLGVDCEANKPRSLRLTTGSHPLTPTLVLWALHERLPVVRVRLNSAEDRERRVQLAGVAQSFDCGQSVNQLLVKIAAIGQWPAADAIEEFAKEREAGVESAGGVHQFQTPVATAEP